MRSSAALPLLALLPVLALAACAGRADLRAAQTPPLAPAAVVLAPYEHRMRDAVVLDWIGGVSQQSYLMAEPSQAVIRPALQRALDQTGLAAGTATRARFGLRVLVQRAVGPDPGLDAKARLVATYTLVERATGETVFETTVDSAGVAPFLGLNESDLRTALGRSEALLKIVNPVAAAFALTDLAYDVDLTSWGGGQLGESDLYRSYDEWTQGDWNEFWEIYRYSVLGAAAAGPLLTAAEFANPLNYLPRASDGARQRAEAGAIENFSRSGAARAALANERAAAASIAAFLVDLSRAERIPVLPILPCHGGADIQAAKRALMARGEAFTTDDCRVPR
jgi:hypothetical protein